VLKNVSERSCLVLWLMVLELESETRVLSHWSFSDPEALDFVELDRSVIVVGWLQCHLT